MRAVLSDAPPLSGAGASNSEDLPTGDEEKIRKLFTEALQKDFGLGAEQQQQGGGTGISEEDLKDAFSMIDQQLGLNPQQPSQQPPPQPSTSTGGSFQDTLRATSERLRSSENAARVIIFVSRAL